MSSTSCLTPHQANTHYVDEDCFLSDPPVDLCVQSAAWWMAVLELHRAPCCGQGTQVGVCDSRGAMCCVSCRPAERIVRLHRKVFAAGASHYGVADCELLAQVSRTHSICWFSVTVLTYCGFAAQ